MMLARNKKAFHDYFIEEKYESGIELIGTEVKSIKAGKVSIKESKKKKIKKKDLIIKKNENTYKYENIKKKKKTRVRKLFLNKKEIEKLHSKIKEQGYAIVPISIYTKNRLVKMEIALAKGKKNYDKRETLKKKDQEREIQKVQKNFR